MSNISIEKRSLRDLFGLDDIPSTITMPVFPDVKNPFVPNADNDYIFSKETVRQVRAFLISPNQDALYITGPTGSGKTSGVLQMAARLNWPVQSITAHGRMELSDLIGHHSLVSTKDGEAPIMQFVHGPLPTAMKNGHILLINEIDLVDPAELSGLNDVLDGRPLVINQNAGEIITPHPMFRVIVTGNSNGSGDNSGLYQGIQAQNIAAMDRYRFMHIGYPEKDVEFSILKKVAPAISDDLVTKMIEVASKVRTQFMGNEELGGNQLSVTVSTRTLVRWAKLTVQNKGAANPIMEALQAALLRRCQGSDAKAIERITKDIFGIAG